jgi:hypothetical protein
VLAFDHPVTRERIAVTAKLPSDLADALRALDLLSYAETAE